jgi:hypothetical protein
MLPSESVVDNEDLISINDLYHFKPKQIIHPLFYHYNSFNGIMIGKEKLVRLFPSKLIKIEDKEKVLTNSNSTKAKKFSFENSYVALQIWKTRCNSPRIDIVVFNENIQQIEIIKDCKSFLKLFKCDLNLSFEFHSLIMP